MGGQKPPCCAVSQSEKVDAGTRTRNSSKAHLDAPDADILESQRAQARGVEQVLSVNNERFLEQLLDPVEIESAKFGPAGADDQGVRSLGHRIRGIAIADRPVQMRLGFRNRDRVAGAPIRASGADA